MILRTSLTIAALIALASCSALKKDQPDYDTDSAVAGNPYGTPGYDTSGTETGQYSPASGATGNPTYAPAAYEDNTPAGKAKPASPGQPAAAAHGGAVTTHTVVKGDTLSGIARKYGVSIASIKTANKMTNDIVRLGTTIKIPAH